MQNAKVTLTGNKLTVVLDLDGATAPSKSGKTQVIATTHGNKPLAEFGIPGRTEVLGINLYRK